MSGTRNIATTQVMNGNLTFSVTTIALDQPTPDEAGCPNSTWPAQITDSDFTSAQILA